MSSFNSIKELAQGYLLDVDLEPLEKAYIFAEKTHADQAHPTSGEPYINHLLSVTEILLVMKLDLQTVISGLLHGVLKQDPALTVKQLEEDFGRDVANIVRGTTKITNVQFNSKLTYQAENVRKLLLAMASDLRVLLVRLADRLHDMRSYILDDKERQKELAQETLELYAPLASRLGIDWMKRELEDLAFKFLFPDEYTDLTARIESSTADRENYVKEVINILHNKLAEIDLNKCEIIGRPKHLYSIYKKIIAQNIPLEKVYDKVAFRIIVDTVTECYETLGVVHANWPPVPGRIKDFISTPKANNYQSMHTTVIGPYGEFMEVQIRTREMDRIAQEGVAAHWAYKEGQAINKEDAKVFKGLKQLVQWLQELKDPKEFLDSVRGELFEPDVYALTPNGEVKEFPQGSTPLDFAYIIHTEVGNNCIGAKVNGKIVPLKYKLQNGDVVEIVTSPKQKPRRDWLSLVRTSRAKSRIRHWLRREEKEKAMNVGREISERELRKHDTSLKKIIKTGHMRQILKAMRCNSLEDLLGKIGSGAISIQNVIKVLQPEDMRTEEAEKAEELELLSVAPPAHKHEKPRSEGIVIEGVDDMLVKISQCCLPVPGDPIMGFITTGRGISIHKANCHNLLATDPQRRIEVSWSADAKTVHRAQIYLVTQNKKGMLAAISNAISMDDANIAELEAKTSEDNLSTSSIVLEVENIDHLNRVLHHLRQIDGVIEVRRR
ncbi:MAG: bifunctional (p)ppGpp synthetase/guanosine-3',5'-bis(diphosphate) 3'-pyrophosphohydrolase [Deltaproteobacteria bacterium]|nr:MAG: bifunctional (p)ppGpp synthetase/guanosine-3',5'-bis(diphosphate) 3'-pyrophosphohydrolase [Deltaproteobacteria bacterium]